MKIAYLYVIIIICNNVFIFFFFKGIIVIMVSGDSKETLQVVLFSNVVVIKDYGIRVRVFSIIRL